MKLGINEGFERLFPKLTESEEELRRCDWCDEFYATEELEDTDFGKICYKCKKAIESKEGPIDECKKSTIEEEKESKPKYIYDRRRELGEKKESPKTKQKRVPFLESVNFKGSKVLSEKVLKEGPGAGYTITSTVRFDKFNSMSLNKVEIDRVGKAYGTDDTYVEWSALFDCDIDCTVSDLEFESYYYGGNIEFETTGKVSKIWVSFVEQFEEEQSEITEEFLKRFTEEHIQDIADTLHYEKVSINYTYGGGWSHATYDGTLTDIDKMFDYENSVYNEFNASPFQADIKLTDNTVIEYIDRVVTGDNIDKVYVVRDYDYDIIDTFEDEDEAIEYAKTHEEAEEVVAEEQIQDINGDWEFTENNDVVWSRREDGE